MAKIIDLRSDTVTLPSREMRNAIATAQLGDDVFGEDPTINQLQKDAANIMGKEAALLVPSGTMGNLISILVHCERGTEIILGDLAHTFVYEAGGISAFGGVHSRQLKNQKDGTLDLDDIKSSIRTENDHFPRTSAITLENTHNLCNGYPITPSYTTEVATIAHENNLKLHIDGARIFNAAVALNIDVKELVQDADSVTFCLSKGLAAPIGSVVCGDKNFIYKAKRIRKALGGGMRQAGIIAAGGIHSLQNMHKQIKLDQQNAKKLANAIDNIGGLNIDIDSIQSNILYFNIDDGAIRSQHLFNQTKKINSYPFEISLNGVKFFESKPNRFRLVTHYGINDIDIEITISELSKMVKK
tara:strand:+ start:63 stop:1133 length:1071 start_codon:yes stop_codon:yes gene_type:complete